MAQNSSFEFHDLPSSSSGSLQRATSRKRPWQAHWPPCTEAKAKSWKDSDSPQILSWKFDRDRPFDRPWRSWTRTTLAKQEVAPMKYQIDSGDVGRRTYQEKLQAKTANNDGCYEYYGFSSVVDENISNLKLSSVRGIELKYLAPLDLYLHEKPYLSRLPFLPKLGRTNIIGETYPAEIFDVSGKETSFDLDISGFLFARLPFPVLSWTDNFVETEYIPALTSWLRDKFNSSGVLVYAYNFRGHQNTMSDSRPWKTPFFRVHCDATPAACLQRLRLHTALGIDISVGKRYRFINIWRPLTGPGQDCPLALCDYRSVRDTDLVKADIVFPHYCDEGYELKFNPAHRWFYKKNMSTDDVIIFKLDDNFPDVAKFCPHSAFVDPTAASGVPPRASLEVRAIIIDGSP